MASKNHDDEKLIKSDEDVSAEKFDRESDPLDSHYPLWVEFRERAPGSYKHTQSLSNIVDNVASAVELDSPELHLAAKYHDVGKMWFPEAFTENQVKEDNVHEELDPWMSYQLLTRHVSDTVTILIAYNFPMEVIQIASQHHGKTVLQSIYEAMKKKNDSVTKEDFRYKTRKPQTVEALILMLCDHAEATSRSIYVDQKKDVEPDVFINNIFNKLMLDGQFDDVELKLGNLIKIQQALAEDVAGNYQKRLKYEEDDELTKE